MPTPTSDPAAAHSLRKVGPGPDLHNHLAPRRRHAAAAADPAATPLPVLPLQMKINSVTTASSSATHGHPRGPSLGRVQSPPPEQHSERGPPAERERDAYGGLGRGSSSAGGAFEQTGAQLALSPPRMTDGLEAYAMASSDESESDAEAAPQQEEVAAMSCDESDTDAAPPPEEEEICPPTEPAAVSPKPPIKAATLPKEPTTALTKKDYVCGCCGTRFQYPKDLVKHERVHTGEKPFSCSVCDTRFARKSDATRHERIHTGAQPTRQSVIEALMTVCAQGNLTYGRFIEIVTAARPALAATIDNAATRAKFDELDPTGKGCPSWPMVSGYVTRISAAADDDRRGITSTATAAATADVAMMAASALAHPNMIEELCATHAAGSLTGARLVEIVTAWRPELAPELDDVAVKAAIQRSLNELVVVEFGGASSSDMRSYFAVFQDRAVPAAVPTYGRDIVDPRPGSTMPLASASGVSIAETAQTGAEVGATTAHDKRPRLASDSAAGDEEAHECLMCQLTFQNADSLDRHLACKAHTGSTAAAAAAAAAADHDSGGIPAQLRPFQAPGGAKLARLKALEHQVVAVAQEKPGQNTWCNGCDRPHLKRKHTCGRGMTAFSPTRVVIQNKRTAQAMTSNRSSRPRIKPSRFDDDEVNGAATSTSFLGPFHVTHLDMRRAMYST